MFILKLSLAILFFILGLQIVLSTVIVKDKGSPSSSLYYDVLPSPIEFRPKVGVYLTNYAGKPIRVIGESQDPQDFMILSLPILGVEDHIWEGKSLTVECWSTTVPVYWEYRGVGKPQVMVRTYRKAADFYNVSSYSYGAVITFSSTNYKQTGEYACKPISSEPSHGQERSLYLFVPGKRLFVQSSDDLEEKVVKVTPKQEEGVWVTLPCAVSDKDASVDLFYGEEKLSLGSSLMYDPSEGFRLKWKGLGALKGLGTYTCVGKRKDGNSKEELRMEIVHGESTNRFSLNRFGSSQTFVGTQKLNLNYNEGAKRIECCTQTQTQPRERRKSYPSSIPIMRLSPCISIADCYLMSSSYPEETKGDSFIKSLNETCVAYELPEIREAGVLLCSLSKPGGAQSSAESESRVQMWFSYEPELGLATNFDNSIPTSFILGIGREQSPYQKDVGYYCNANSFFFSNGIKWAIQPKNGNRDNLIFLKDQDSRSTIQLNDSQVKRVYCFAPIWDSANEWRNASIIVP